MRTAILIILSILWLNTFSQTKLIEYKTQIIYKLTYQPDSNSTSKLVENMELVSNSEQSIFRSSKKAFADTAISKGIYYDKLANHSSFMYTIIKKYDKNAINYYDVISILTGELKHYVEESSMLNWNIEKEIKIVNDYTCQKATVRFGNRNWDAWFAVDIPISDGPYKFCGLPGLIISICDSQNYWSFELLSLERLKNSNIDSAFLNSSTVVDKPKFYKELIDYKMNQVQINEAAGLLSFPDPKVRDSMIMRVKEKFKKDNNWIELW